jgi:hypothetical protein
MIPRRLGVNNSRRVAGEIKAVERQMVRSHENNKYEY